MIAEVLDEKRERVEEFRRKHRIALLTMLFTDIVGSTGLKQALGDRAAIALIERHHALIREALSRFAEAEVIDTSGDSFFCVFAKPSDAAHFALIVQRGVRELARETRHPVLDRIGIHVGEVFVHQRGEGERDLFGIQIDAAARIMSLGGADQILLSRFAFDNARQVLRGHEIEGIGELSWLNHGYYELKGVEEPVEVCEVGEVGLAQLLAPGDSEKAHRFHSPDAEPVLGWRPSDGQRVPNTQWTLERPLGEGGFGEVWLARHETLKQRRVIKFCFRADRARSLKREVTLFRILRERVGEQRGIVTVHDVFFDEPPFYIVMDFVDGPNLSGWVAAHSPLTEMPLATRLDIVAQAADALQAAHDAGVIHRDVKPSNILVAEERGSVQVKLTDFGIGQVVSPEALAGMTHSIGFTQTMLSTASATGTHLYMAPELLSGRPATTRSDLYSLGVVLYQLVVGDLSRPLTTDWAEDIADPLLREDIRRCVAGDAAKRFAGAVELAERLRELPQRHAAHISEQARLKALERRAYRRGLTLAGSVAVLIIGAIVWLALFGFQKARVARVESRAAALERDRSEELLTRAELQRAEELFDADDASGGLAYLSRVLRRRPNDPVTAARLLSALRDRSWFLPVIGPLDQESAINDMAFSPDGHKLATYGPSGVRIWDMHDGRLSGKTGPLPVPADDTEAKAPSSPKAIAWSPDGRKIAVIHRTGQVLDAGTLQPLVADLMPASDGPFVNWEGGPWVAWSPDGRWLFAATEKGGGRLWDMVAGRPWKSSWKGGRYQVRSPRWSPSSTALLFRTSGSVLVWDVAGGKFQQPWTEAGWYPGAEWNADGSRLLMWTTEGVLQAWELATHRAVGTALDHHAPIARVACDPSGRFVATTTLDGTLRLWEAASGRLHGAPIPHGGPVWFHWSRDGARILVINPVTGAMIRDPDSLELLGQVILGAGNAMLSPDGLRLAVGSPEGTAQIWDVSSGQSHPRRFPNGAECTTAVFSPDGSRVATAGCLEARVWKTQDGRLTAILPHDREVHALSWNPDGRTLATASDSLQFWDTADGQKKGPPLKLGEHLNGLGFSADGSIVFATGVDKNAGVWDTATGALRAAISIPHCRGGQLNRSGSRLLLGASDGWAQVFDTRTGQPLAWRLEHVGELTSFTFSPDERSILSADIYVTGSARLWSAESGETLSPRMRTSTGVWNARFSADQSRIATAEERGAQLWSCPGFERIGMPMEPRSFVYDARFSPGSDRLTTIALGNVRVWDAASGRPVSERLRHSWETDGTVVVRDEYRRPMRNRLFLGGTMALGDFSPDGESFLAASDNGTALLWETPRGENAPLWLADLAEAVAERRIDEHGAFVAVPPARLDFLRERFIRDLGADVFTRTARWFFKDRRTRPISPSTQIACADYARALLKEGSLPAVLLARRIAAGTPGITAALAANADYTARPALLGQDNDALSVLLSILRIPPRDPQTAPSMIDLSPHYTHALDSPEWMGSTPNSLAALPRGVQHFDGTAFDIRGIIQVYGSGGWQSRLWPEAARGISVGRACERVHFLHAATYAGEPADTEVGAYLIHYADGTEARVPVVQARDVVDWQLRPPMDGVKIVWRGVKRIDEKDADIGLCESAWENPHPETRIESIDFISMKTKEAPFLVAITTE